MVELQRSITEPSVALVAISYDPVATLKQFGEAHGVTYPLLADVGSKVITDLGLLNVTMQQERAAYGQPMEDRHRGLAYPGTFFLDEAGIVVDKRFEQSHRIRPSGATLLNRLLGGEPEKAAALTTITPGVGVLAWLDTDVVHANQLQEAHVRLVLDEGVHIYTDPVPDGFYGLGVRLSGDEHLRSQPAEVPAGMTFQVDGIPETFRVLDGQIDLAIPFMLLHNKNTAGDERRDVGLTLDVSYQACTESECFIPERVSLQFALVEESNPG